MGTCARNAGDSASKLLTAHLAGSLLDPADDAKEGYVAYNAAWMWLRWAHVT